MGKRVKHEGANATSAGEGGLIVFASHRAVKGFDKCLLAPWSGALQGTQHVLEGHVLEATSMSQKRLEGFTC
jgi:hypothetical protein